MTGTLSYDQLNRLVNWNAGSSSQEWYVYDAGGNRVLKRSISGGSTTLTGYAFGLQELDYSGTGTPSAQVDYYALAGHLVGSFNGTSTSYDLTSVQGSVLLNLTSSAVQGEQDDGPYGNTRYSRGTIGTAKGYTGQVFDPVTGLYYYNARYYDPVAGVFLSPDTKQGSAQGMDPYSYVGGNPETNVDPTGQRIVGPADGGGESAEPIVSSSGQHETVVYNNAGASPQVLRPTSDPVSSVTVLVPSPTTSQKKSSSAKPAPAAPPVMPAPAKPKSKPLSTTFPKGLYSPVFAGLTLTFNQNFFTGLITMFVSGFAYMLDSRGIPIPGITALAWSASVKINGLFSWGYGEGSTRVSDFPTLPTNALTSAPYTFSLPPGMYIATIIDAQVTMSDDVTYSFDVSIPIVLDVIRLAYPENVDPPYRGA